MIAHQCTHHGWAHLLVHGQTCELLHWVLVSRRQTDQGGVVASFREGNPLQVQSSPGLPSAPALRQLFVDVCFPEVLLQWVQRQLQRFMAALQRSQGHAAAELSPAPSAWSTDNLPNFQRQPAAAVGLQPRQPPVPCWTDCSCTVDKFTLQGAMTTLSRCGAALIATGSGRRLQQC